MLSVSNIAWTHGGDPAFFRAVSQAQFDGIDVAPTKIWPNWVIPKDNGQAFKSLLDDFGLRVFGMQSLFYDAGPLNLFAQDEREWRSFLDHFDRLASIANTIGATRLVFGAPKNRDPSHLCSQATEVCALERFNALGDVLRRSDLFLCIEPVSGVLGGQFLRTTREAGDFLFTLNHRNVRLNLDTAALFLEGPDIAATLTKYQDLICHVHASEPGLKSFQNPQVDHAEVSASLASIGYKDTIAIEMNCENGSERENLEHALMFVKNAYSLP